METQPKPVPSPATQLGSDPLRWSWVEPSVWTPRMLSALEHGVKGGCWFSLVDKVFSPRCLHAAAGQVEAKQGASGVDHVSVTAFGHRRETEVAKLSTELRTGKYRPQAVRRVHIPKPGTKEMRPLGIPTVRDRVVQAALVKVIEPIFERDFAEHSYGFRPGRGCKDALRRVDALLKAGYTFVVDADLKSYFDTIPHQSLMARLRTKISDGRVLSLIEAFLKAEIMDSMQAWKPTAGAPQGAVLSPLLSNIYLDPLDHLLADRGLEMVRYADDFVILCRTAEDAQRALEIVQQWTFDNGLTLHPEKTRVVDSLIHEFEFLGYRFVKHRRYPRKKSLRKLKDAIRAKTPRKSGHSLPRIIADVNRTTRGWFEYFQHSRRTTFPPLDSWIRMRLRSILRKRSGIRGVGRGKSNIYWPNQHFAVHGLFSLASAHAAVVQSSRR